MRERALRMLAQAMGGGGVFCVVMCLLTWDLEPHEVRAWQLSLGFEVEMMLLIVLGAFLLLGLLSWLLLRWKPLRLVKMMALEALRGVLILVLTIGLALAMGYLYSVTAAPYVQRVMLEVGA